MPPHQKASQAGTSAMSDLGGIVAEFDEVSWDTMQLLGKEGNDSPRIHSPIPPPAWLCIGSRFDTDPHGRRQHRSVFSR
jgi:hypothetical protein